MGESISSCQCLGGDRNSHYFNSIIEQQLPKKIISTQNTNHTNSQDHYQHEQQKIRISSDMLQSNGVPRHGAYKTYVRPPSTIGHQSYLINQMHQQSQVPRQVWEINDDIFETNAHYNNHPSVRKTQTIQEFRQNSININKTANSQFRRTQQIFKGPNNNYRSSQSNFNILATVQEQNNIRSTQENPGPNIMNSSYRKPNLQNQKSYQSYVNEIKYTQNPKYSLAQVNSQSNETKSIKE